MSFANAINSVFSNIDAFGNLATSQLTPQIQLQFAYNINTDVTTSTVTGSGTVTHSTPFVVCSTTATTSSSAKISSKSNLHYRTGEGGLCMFTAIFTAGSAGSVQEIGLGDENNGLFFGFNGASFGINRRYNTTDNYIPQSSWNQDKMDGTGISKLTLDPTKGNVYKIQYQWLGFGALNFYIESEDTGKFIFVHQIKYANLNTETSVLNPSMPVTISVENTTNNTDIILKCGSISAFVEGVVSDTGLRKSINNEKTNITTELNILTIKSNDTFNSISNKKVVKPLFLSLSNTSNANSLFKIVANATLGGSPSYTDINTSTSVVSYDTAGTTVSDGTLVGAFYVNGGNDDQINIAEFANELNPGDTLTISATSSGAQIVASASIIWSEQF